MNRGTDKIKNIQNKIKEYFILPSIIFYFIFITAVIIHVISYNSVKFSDFFNRNISSVIRFMLAKITNFIPFSLAELIIISLPIIVTLIMILAVKFSNNGKKTMIRFIICFLSVATLFYSVFVYSFAPGYRGSSIEQKLQMERKKVSVDELYNTAVYLLENIASLINDIDYIYGSSSVIPYSLDEMNFKLNEAYESLCNKYDFIPRLKSNIKYVLLSEPMTYTHISGVYTYYTGEANLNINFPDYTLPYTAAHELSHQRGIAKEDEANFLAFLVCLESKDPYIRYSGFLNMFEYVSNSLYKADNEKYMELYMTVDIRIKKEFLTYSKFFDKYRNSVASNVSNKINDTFLKSQGQSEGTKSYGRVVDLAVAYYINMDNKVVN